MKSNITLTGHIFLIAITLLFSYQLLTVPTPWIFPDSLNLLIHEVGHLIFMPFGQFLQILGGSLFQTIVPCVFITYFLIRKEYFSASFMLFWVANNVINVSVYMEDAESMQLPLLGGDGAIHDWNWLLTYMGQISNTQLIGQTVFFYGVFVLVFSIIGMVWLTYVQAKQA